MLPKMVLLPHKYCYQGVDMTRGSIQEYAAAVRDRYCSADKTGKGKILDEFVKVTGYHRKAAIRALLNAPKQSRVVVADGLPDMDRYCRCSGQSGKPVTGFAPSVYSRSYQR
jgi:hypothetical protein